MGKTVSKYTREERKAFAERFAKEHAETGIGKRLFAVKIGVSEQSVHRWVEEFCGKGGDARPVPVDVTDKLREAEISFSMDGHSFTLPESGLKRFLGALR